MLCYACHICSQPERVEVITPPATTAITKAFALAQLGRDASDTTYDDLLAVYIPAAVKKAEDWTGKTFIDTSYRAYWNCFSYCLLILAAPNFSVLNFKYLDTDGNEQDFPADDYNIYTDRHYAQIVPVSSFPSTEDKPDAVYVDYKAGYGTSDTDVPADVRVAIAMMVVKMIANRGDCSDECGDVPCDAQRLLMPYRPVEF